jgi:hypothetical protein
MVAVTDIFLQGIEHKKLQLLVKLRHAANLWKKG